MYPSEYGGDPSGVEDSSDAFMKALEDAFEMEDNNGGTRLTNGIKDLGGVIIDLQGGNYKLAKPIIFPSSPAGNLVVTISLSHNIFLQVISFSATNISIRP